MYAGNARLELTIDVLDIGTQRASAQWRLSTEGLIRAILQEFRELEQLGLDPADYQLIDAATGVTLDEKPLDALYANDAKDIHLKLAEKPILAPRGAELAAEPIYLREQASGRVFRLAWLPAIIGRSDYNLPDNQLLAVNLEPLPTGLRVSRRHAELTEQDGQYFIQRMSGNPIMLYSNGETINLIDASRTPIDHGDLIVLERSQIWLKFVRQHADG